MIFWLFSKKTGYHGILALGVPWCNIRWDIFKLEIIWLRLRSSSIGFRGMNMKNNFCPRNKNWTNRDRPKLAPYLRLKNSKSTSKCQSILFYSTRISFEESLTMPEKLLWFFNFPSVAKLQKNESFPLGEFFGRKLSQCRKNWLG